MRRWWLCDHRNNTPEKKAPQKKEQKSALRPRRNALSRLENTAFPTSTVCTPSPPLYCLLPFPCPLPSSFFLSLLSLSSFSLFFLFFLSFFLSLLSLLSFSLFFFSLSLLSFFVLRRICVGCFASHFIFGTQPRVLPNELAPLHSAMPLRAGVAAGDAALAPFACSQRQGRDV